MATRESLAIREEQAQARIAKATKEIAKHTGVTIETVQTSEKDPFARNAALAEQTADMLEQIVKAVAPESEPEPEDGQTDNSELDDNQEPPDGNDNTGSGSDNPAQPPSEPIKRSQAGRKRQ